MDAAVKDLGEITALARDNGKWNEQHSKVGPRDMLTSLKRERGRGTVLDAEADMGRGMAMWSQCIGWPVQGVKI